MIYIALLSELVLTGEFMPVSKAQHATVTAGTVNCDGKFTVSRCCYLPGCELTPGHWRHVDFSSEVVSCDRKVRAWQARCKGRFPPTTGINCTYHHM